MTNRREIIKSLLIMLVIVVVFGAAMFGLNFHTGPLIEANQAGAQAGPLLEVFPEAKGFEALTLEKDAPQNIEFFKETSDKGYAFKAQVVSQFTKGTTELVVGVSSDGKIVGIKCNTYNETKPLPESFLGTFVGLDSALAGVEIANGTTYSSKAIKEAVELALNALINNGKITAGVKGDDQILAELIPSVHPGLASAGALKCDTVEGTGNIVTAYKGQNSAGFAYIMKKGDTMVLAITNNLGVCKVYNTEGADVTADNAELVTEALAHTSANGTNFEAKNSKFTNMMTTVGEATNFQTLSLEVFNTVVYAVEFEIAGAKYYGFYSKSFGYEVMDVYYVLNAEGAIAKMRADTFIFEEDYFFGFGGMPENYAGKFEGATEETWDETTAVIATATMTSNAMKVSTKDIFAAFKVLNGGAE